jgi:hypothetical protein
LLGKPEGKRPLGRPRRRWGKILRRIVRKWEGLGGAGWSGLRIGRVGGQFKYGNELSGSINAGKFLTSCRTN